MFVMVFVEHILWGGNCIQRQKNTGMIGVSFSKSVFKVRIAPRPFSWSPKVCFTATIPYMAENSTMEMIYTPAYMIICIIIMHSKAKEYWYARCIFLQVSI